MSRSGAARRARTAGIPVGHIRRQRANDLRVSHSATLGQLNCRSQIRVSEKTLSHGENWASAELASEQLQLREVLRIDDADWDLVIIDDNEIVDAVAFEEIQNFHGEFVLVNGHRV
jgi:hypothetical protein